MRYDTIASEVMEMIVFDHPLKLLSDHGWSTYRLQKERKISNGTIARLRAGLSVSTDTIGTICELCDCQPGDIISYVREGREGE